MLHYYQLSSPEPDWLADPPPRILLKQKKITKRSQIIQQDSGVSFYVEVVKPPSPSRHDLREDEERKSRRFTLSQGEREISGQRKKTKRSQIGHMITGEFF